MEAQAGRVRAAFLQQQNREAGLCQAHRAELPLHLDAPGLSPSESTVDRGREAPEVAFCLLITQLRQGNEHTQDGARKLTLVRDSGVEEAGTGAPGKCVESKRGVG